MPLVAGAAVNCVMQMWKEAFYACYRNLDLPFAINWKMLRNDINKNYCCVWRYCRYPQGLQSIIHHAKHASVPITSRCSVEDGWMNYCSSFRHRSYCTLCQKKFQISSEIMVFPSRTLSQTPNIENFALACRSLKCVINVARKSGCCHSALTDKLHCCQSSKLIIGVPLSSDGRPQVIIKLCLQSFYVVCLSQAGILDR